MSASVAILLSPSVTNSPYLLYLCIRIALLDLFGAVGHVILQPFGIIMSALGLDYLIEDAVFIVSSLPQNTTERLQSLFTTLMRIFLTASAVMKLVYATALIAVMCCVYLVADLLYPRKTLTAAVLQEHKLEMFSIYEKSLHDHEEDPSTTDETIDDSNKHQQQLPNRQKVAKKAAAGWEPGLSKEKFTHAASKVISANRLSHPVGSETGSNRSGINLAAMAQQQSQNRESPLLARKASSLRIKMKNSPMGQFFNHIAPSKSASIDDNDDAADGPDSSTRVMTSQRIAMSPLTPTTPAGSVSSRRSSLSPSAPASSRPNSSSRRPSAYALIANPLPETSAATNSAAGSSTTGRDNDLAETRSVSTFGGFGHDDDEDDEADGNDAGSETYDQFSETESLAPSEYSVYSSATGTQRASSRRSNSSASSRTSRASIVSRDDRPVSNHELIVASVEQPQVLVGWRILIKGYGAGVVMATRRQKFKATKFDIQLETGQSVLLPLKRSTKKGTVPFSPIAKVK